MSNLLRLSACLFLCFSLNSYGATIFSLQNQTGRLQSFDLFSETTTVYDHYANSSSGLYYFDGKIYSQQYNGRFQYFDLNSENTTVYFDTHSYHSSKLMYLNGKLFSNQQNGRLQSFDLKIDIRKIYVVCT